MNEGPYLTDWVFHHLYFGFDAIEVWINGSEDESVRIMSAIHDAHSNVTFRVVDDLLDVCIREGRYFQYRAYAKLAKRAEREGYAHVAFLDLDEYWIPRDFATQVSDFIPQDPEINVISFQWGEDVPDASRRAFSHPLFGSVHVQLDPHVKSVVRLDDRVRQFRPHTARTTGGVRLLVRDSFPMPEERAQQWGSFIMSTDFASMSAQLPEAFVLHAMHRSPAEYLGSLKKAFRRSYSDSSFRSNRRGFVPRQSPQLNVALPDVALREYFHSLARLKATVSTDSLTRQSGSMLIRRGESVLNAAVTDPRVMEQLRGALRGLSVPLLDRRYPEWHSHLEWCVDGRVSEERGEFILGWAFSDADHIEIEFAFRIAAGAEWPVESVEWSSRADVKHVHPGAPVDCGFRLPIPVAFIPNNVKTDLLARPKGSAVWSRLRVPSASSAID